MLLNMLGFNLAWFGLIFFGNTFIPISLLMIVLHLSMFSNINNEMRLVILVTVIGVSVDSFLHFFGFFIFPDSTSMTPWLVILWVCFACTICHSLTFLSPSVILQAVVGAIFSPLSYIAAQKIGAVNFGYSLLTTYITLALIWGGLFICFFYLKSVMTETRIKYA